MPVYNAPVEDMKFLLHELFADEKLQGLPGNEDFTPDVLDAVLAR